MISNSLKKISKNTRLSPITLTQERPGLPVSQSRKLETNQPVDHAGPLELPKLCLIDSALPQVRRTKQESPLKTYSHAVDSHVEWVAMVDSQVELGASSRDQDSLQVTNTTTTTGAELTHSLHVNTTLRESIPLVEPLNLLPNVTRLATLSPNVNTTMIKLRPRTLTVYPTTLPRFKLKS